MDTILSVLWWLLRATAQVVFEVLCQATGSALLQMLTFGRVRGEAIAPPVGSSRPFSIYRQKGALVVGGFYAFLLGLIFWFVLFACIVVRPASA